MHSIHRDCAFRAWPLPMFFGGQVRQRWGGFSIREARARGNFDRPSDLEQPIFAGRAGARRLSLDLCRTTKPPLLLVFGNPPLGTQFIAANPSAGLDWPVRLLVTQDGSGAVWTVYTDFAWIAARHGIVNRTEQFKMASMVIASITSSVKA